jgi:hypothetical protein
MSLSISMNLQQANLLTCKQVKAQALLSFIVLDDLLLKTHLFWLGVVACTCNPATWEDRDSRPAEREVSKTPSLISINKLGIVACVCHPGNTGGIGRRITI